MLRRTFLVLITLLACAFPALAAPSDEKTTLLPVDSHWSGMQLHDKAHVGGKRDRDHTCTFVVKDRKEANFAAVYSSRFNDNNFAVRIEGSINQDGIFQAHTTKIISGEPEQGIMDREWDGQATGSDMKLSWKQRNGAVQTAELSLDSGGKKKKK